MKKMNEKPGHVRPENGFYDKLNALMFVPQKDLSGVRVRPPSQVLASLQKVNAVFHQFEGVKPTSGASKIMPKRALQNHSSLPVKSANARRVEAHHRTLNKKNRVNSNLLVKHSVSVSDLNNTKRFKMPTQERNGNQFRESGNRLANLLLIASLQWKARLAGTFPHWHPITVNGLVLLGGSTNVSMVSWILDAQDKGTGYGSCTFSNFVGKVSLDSVYEMDVLEVAYRQIHVTSANYDMVDLLKDFFEQRQTPQVIEKFIVKTQRALNATVRFVRTDNGTEFVNKTLDGWFESVGISHEQAYLGLHNRTALSKDGTVLLCTACYTLNRSLVHTLHEKTYYELLKGKKPNLQYFRVFGSLCYPTNDYDKLETVQVAFDELTEGGEQSVQTSSGLAPQQMTSVPNSTELELTALQSGRSRSALVKDPEPPSVPPTEEQVDDLFQWFDDDEVVPIPPVVPITPVNVPAPENANGSPSTTVISEGAPAVTESLLPHQIPLPDTSDSDVDHTVIRTPSFELKLLQMQTMQEVMTANRRITLGSASILGHPSCYIAGQPKSKKITAILQQTTEAEYIALLGS
ncbi:retrovirus-related pol polyprotein from transposon TNT 1-94 [Tanacetum coccineum]